MREPFDLREYRLRYAQCRTDTDLAEAHRLLPWIFTYDDHEVDNNWAADISEHYPTVSKEELVATSVAPGGNGNAGSTWVTRILAENPHIKYVGAAWVRARANLPAGMAFRPARHPRRHHAGRRRGDRRVVRGGGR